jgi:RND family efflux transporter MFP subunit
MKLIVKILIPIVIFVAAFGVLRWQMSTRPEPKKIERKKITPIVSVSPAEKVAGYRYKMTAYGTVYPAKKVEMLSEVAGRVVWMNSKMKTGGMFAGGEEMFRVDDTDYKASLDSAVSALKAKEVELQKIIQEAEISNKEWEIWNKTAGTERKPSPLIGYEPQMRAAEAAVQSAQSAVKSAENNLSKVSFRAPFDCVVTAESVEMGKVVRNGESTAAVVGSEYYEIYVPIAAKDAVRFSFSSDASKASDGEIELAEGQSSWKWKIRADRLLPDADGKTGMLQAVLVAEKPFDTRGERPMLPIGASVRVQLNDTKANDIIRIPDEALRDGNLVWVLADGKVQIRQVHTAETRDEYVFISSGLLEGENVITSALSGVIDGMAATAQGGKKTGGDK